MDGNGRWAERRRRPRSFGHREGQKAVRAAIEFCLRRGVEALTLFAFSSENWKRPQSEVGALMQLFLNALDREVDELHENGVRIAFVGDLGVSARASRAHAERDDARPARTTKLQAQHRGQLRRSLGHRRGGAPCRARSRRGAPSRRGHQRADARAVLLPRRSAAGRSVHPHRRRAAHQQFPALAGRLRRALLHRYAVARRRRRRARRRARRFRAPRAPLRPDLRRKCGRRADAC